MEGTVINVSSVWFVQERQTTVLNKQHLHGRYLELSGFTGQKSSMDLLTKRKGNDSLSLMDSIFPNMSKGVRQRTWWSFL